MMSHTDLTNAEVVDIIQSLAREHHSAALAQLASKITAVLRFGEATGDDPFAKVEGLIQELIDRLVAEVFLFWRQTCLATTWPLARAPWRGRGSCGGSFRFEITGEAPSHRSVEYECQPDGVVRRQIVVFQ